MTTDSACLVKSSAAVPNWIKGRCASFLSRLQPDLAVTTRKGGDGRPVNQDQVMLNGGSRPLIGVADGISRSNKGQIAARLAFLPFLQGPRTGANGLVSLALTSHALVTEIYHLFGEAKVGGSTLLVAELRRGAVATVLSIGDSRAYIVRPHGLFLRRFTCRQITVDQVYGELKKRVRIERPERYPDHVMYQSIGTGLIPSEVAEQRITIPAGGMLILATDGLFKKMVDDCAEIADVASRAPRWSAQAIADSLVHRALELESLDDISVAVVIPSYLLGARWPFWCAITTAIVARGLLL